MMQTETAVVETTVLDEVVHWIKTLTSVGVSPDTAAVVTSKFFIASGNLTSEYDEEFDDEDEYYEE